jgi:hypothetical protein
MIDRYRNQNARNQMRDQRLVIHLDDEQFNVLKNTFHFLDT